MSIQVSCAACQAQFRVKDEHAGRTGRCPRCKAPVQVPAATVHASAAAAPPQPDEPDEYTLADAPRMPRAVPLRTAKVNGNATATDRKSTRLNSSHLGIS